MENNQKNGMSSKIDLKTVIKELEKKYGEGTVTTLDDKRKIKIDTTPTGSISLDYALGIKGYPRGRIIEIFGPESSGKTTLALSAIVQAQKKGLKCVFIDAEHSLDSEYASSVGISLSELFLNQPSSGEQALDVVENFVKSSEIGLIVIDSVAALTPQAEIDGVMGQVHIGLQARLMGQALRKLTALASKTKTTILFINQTRQAIGVKWGNPIVTPGGMALKFYTSVRIEIRIIARLKKNEEHIGNKVRVKVVKNKLATPFKTTEFDIIFGKGISLESDVINTGLKENIIQKQGITLSFGDIKLGSGAEKAKTFLEKDQKILQSIIDEIKKKKD